MAMGLLFPAALAALVALIVPLVIHIARRSEQQPTNFAALRWLRQKPRPRSRLRFDEWPLLLLRLLLLALVALFLARPVLWGAADQSPYVAVVPGARVDPAAFPDARLHWLFIRRWIRRRRPLPFRWPAWSGNSTPRCRKARPSPS